MIYVHVTPHSEISDLMYVRCLSMFSKMLVSKDYLSETKIILFRIILAKLWPLSGIKLTFHWPNYLTICHCSINVIFLAKEVVFSVVCVCLSVCLFVSNIA